MYKSTRSNFGIVLGLTLIFIIIITFSPYQSLAADDQAASIKGFNMPQAGPVRQSGSSPDDIWQDANEPDLQIAGQRDIIPDKYRLVTADIDALDNLLNKAPVEDDLAAMGDPVILYLPMPDGTFQRFRIAEYLLLTPSRPDIKTFNAYGLDDPTATGVLDRTPAGFHGMIISASGTIFIDPYARGNTSTYISYFKKDYGNFWQKTFNAQEPVGISNISGASTPSTGPLLRTYQIAVATTAEYTAGDQANAQAAVTTTINRVRQVYKKELSVDLTLINNLNLIHTSNAGIYSNPNNGNTTLGENQTRIDAVVGNGNYDIGHVFHRNNGGGIAGLGVLCSNPNKAEGYTSSSVPNGDPFDVDFVSHEIGHQFGANHTYNTNAGNCNTRNAATAYEPGSGSTIMSYVGICGQNQNLQSNADDVFHIGSINEMVAHLNSVSPGVGLGCGVTTASGNNPPTSVNAGADYTIPQNTPFELNGSATDADADALTYSWEEFDVGTVWDATQAGKNVLPNTDADAVRPIFRSHAPVTRTNRVFPAMSNILGNTYQNSGESLPTQNRTMQFRLTTRDNKGGVAYDTAQVTVNTGSGPFRVTTPTGTEVWAPGSQQTITWNVANTTNAPVSCSNVNILMSTDGGLTFPSTVAGNTPNDGTETVTIPGTASINAVIKVQCANNIFFDASSVAACNSLFNDNHEGANNWTVNNGAGTNNWVRQSNAANAYSGNNYWFVNNNGGTDTDSYLNSPTVNASTNNFLRFSHKYNLESGFDGGVVEINVNGGGWTRITKNRFIQNGYNATMRADSFTPLQNEDAFTGNSSGYIISVVDLATFVSNGQNFQIRFREVNDQTGGVDGWYVDDVLVCSVTSVPTVNLALTKIASTNTITQGGGVLTYTLVAQNNGTLAATGIILTDTVPTSTTLDVSSLTGATNNGTTPGSLITWNTGQNLAQGQSLTRTFAVTVSATVTNGNQIVNTAYLSASNATVGKNSSTTTTVNDGTTNGNNYLPIILKN